MTMVKVKDDRGDDDGDCDDDGRAIMTGKVYISSDDEVSKRELFCLA